MKSKSSIEKSQRHPRIQTSDFCLAATLLTLGFSLLELDRSNPKRIQFIFGKDESFPETMQKYWNQKIKLNPQDFYSSQRQLKTIMYQGVQI